MESKRTMDVPERSLLDFCDGRCPKDKSRKLHINFQISTCLGSGPTPGFSWVLLSVTHVSSMEPKRTLIVPERNLGDFLYNGSQATYQF